MRPPVQPIVHRRRSDDVQTIKEILRTADGIGDTPMQTGSPEEYESLIDAAKCVVATAFGNTDGMSFELQLEAIRAAAGDLQAELEQLDI